MVGGGRVSVAYVPFDHKKHINTWKYGLKYILHKRFTNGHPESKFLSYKTCLISCV